MLSTLVNFFSLIVLLNNLVSYFTNLENQELHRFYHHYYVVLSVLIVMDNAFSFILYRIPYYQILKLISIAAIGVKECNVSFFIFNVYLVPLVKKLETLYYLGIEKMAQIKNNYQSRSSYQTILDKGKVNFSIRKLFCRNQRPIVDLNSVKKEVGEDKTHEEAGESVNNVNSLVEGHDESTTEIADKLNSDIEIIESTVDNE